MKTPICELCGKTATLCSACRSKLKNGRITETDFRVATFLYQLNEGYNISGASFEHALDLGRVVLILTSGNVGLLIGKEGRVVSELSMHLGKKVRIAECSGDMKKTISDILLPVELLGINTVYTKDGECCRVRLPKAQIMRLPMDLDSLERILKSLLKKEVKLSLE
ncbi:hypothetical protein AUJ17_02305 [Candidatus Micrarchaeota archaeon CG1_02_47_40]|nr:MAG: hypothetical protein AUJ17_02305 [Candidatus Micrarchaeota archaeon CG1_02_47_40]